MRALKTGAAAFHKCHFRSDIPSLQPCAVSPTGQPWDSVVHEDVNTGRRDHYGPVWWLGTIGRQSYQP